MNDQSIFNDFKFALGQEVVHRVTGNEGIVMRRVLVQAQFPQNIGRCYGVCWGIDTYTDALEIELGSAEEEG